MERGTPERAGIPSDTPVTPGRTDGKGALTPAREDAVGDPGEPSPT